MIECAHTRRKGSLTKSRQKKATHTSGDTRSEQRNTRQKMTRTKDKVDNSSKHRGTGRKSLHMPPMKAPRTKKEAIAASGGGVVKKPHRWHPGTVALRNIRKYQKGSELLIRKRPFERLVRELSEEHIDEVRFQPEAITLIQQYIEARTVNLLQKSVLACIHASRKTVKAKDFAHAVNTSEL